MLTLADALPIPLPAPDGCHWLDGGGITSPRGFFAAGVYCGIKKDAEKLDLAVIHSSAPATAAGVFTTNRVQAAPVLHCRQLLADSSMLEAGSSFHTIVINSGNANACTGEAGLSDAREMSRLAAAALRADLGGVLVASTGVIGRRLPMGKLRDGIPAACAALSADGGERAALAICTTDTRPKARAIRIELSGGNVTLGGMTKGAGMIGPEMLAASAFAPFPKTATGPAHATTLGFITTDAQVPAAQLESLLIAAIDESYNVISIDGDTSTNDTVLLLANGESGAGLLTAQDTARFAAGLRTLLLYLALEIVRDGEGASRILEIRVQRANSRSEAFAIARTVGNSPLVKTAFCDGEPNWGRLMMAVGRAGVVLEPHHVSIRVGKLLVVSRGQGTDHAPEELTHEMTRLHVQIEIDLGGDAEAAGEQLGRQHGKPTGSATFWTCDLSEEYVRINARYLT